jgi:hypothetical protein
MAGGLMRFGEKKKRRSESKSGGGASLEESLRSRSLAPYVDLRRKAEYEEKKKVERLKKKKEKMRAREEKLHAAQKRAELEIAKGEALLKLSGVFKSDKEKEESKKTSTKSIFETSPVLGGGFVAVYALILIITVFTIRSDLNKYKVELQKKSKLTEDEASQVIDTAESATVPMLAIGFVLMAIGGAFAFMSSQSKDKKPAFSPTILLALFLGTNAFMAVYGGINIAGADYFSEIDNTASYILFSMSGIVSLGAGAYLFQTMGGSSSSSSSSSASGRRR